MKIIVGLLASISVLLAGCGGRYDESGSSVDNSGANSQVGGTFNLAQGLANFAKTGVNKTFILSGTCTGRLIYVIDPATSTATFEGGTKFVANSTQNTVFSAPCIYGGGAGTPRTEDKGSAKIYYDANYIEAGFVVDNGTYSVMKGFFNPPTDVHVGDTGSYIIDEYLDATKKYLVVEQLYTYVIKSDTQSSVIYEVTESMSYGNGAYTGKNILTYRLDLNGQMTFLSIEGIGTYKPGSGIDFRFIMN